MDRILADKRLRVIWLVSFGLFLFSVVLSRILLETAYPVLPGSGSSTNVVIAPVEILKKVLEGLLSSGLVTFCLGLVVYFGTRQLREAKEEIRVVPVDELFELFTDAQGRATFWYFKGGLGRYLTSTALPGVLNNGRTAYRFRAYIVDPFNADLCKEMARSRKGSFTQEKVRIETLTTIVEYVRQVHAKLPSVESAFCGLIDDFAPLRVDLSDVGAIVTHDDPTAPAVFYKDGSFFCDGHRQELTTGPNSYINFDVRNLAHRLDADPCGRGAVTFAYVKQVLEILAADLKRERPQSNEQTFSEAEFKLVVKCANARESPYVSRKRRLLNAIVIASS